MIAQLMHDTICWGRKAPAVLSASDTPLAKSSQLYQGVPIENVRQQWAMLRLPVLAFEHCVGLVGTNVYLAPENEPIPP